MRSKLLNSFFFVALFWWTLTTLWWSVTDPNTNLKSMRALDHMFPFLHLPVPKGNVTVLDALSMQKYVLVYWTGPILLCVGLFAVLGLGVVWFGAYKKKQERDAREQSGGEFRGIGITVGQMPRPKQLPQDILELGAKDSEVLETLTEKEKALLLEILGVLSAHPDAYAGEGHAASLLEMAVNAVEGALSHKSRPGLAAIVAAASELGKLTAYKKDGAGAWVATKDVHRESATHLATLASWWELPTEDRMAVTFAVRYQGNPDELIDAGGNSSVLRLAKSLLYKAAAATEKASTEERERVLSKQELPDLAFKVFIDNLSNLGFQDGMPKGVKAIGWKIGNRIYLLEIKLRETLLAKLPEDVRGALTAKEKRGLHPFTVELMKSLNSKGWLVKDINGTKVTAREALWNIQAGKLPYKGVLVLDVPADYKEKLPAKDSIYAVTVTGPLFSNAGSASINANDMASMGLVANPSQKKPQAEKPPVEKAADKVVLEKPNMDKSASDDFALVMKPKAPSAAPAAAPIEKTSPAGAPSEEADPFV